MKKNPNNVEFVKNIMEFSEHGAIAQAMVMEAINAYTAFIVEDPMPEEGEVFPEMPLIQKQTWWLCAADIQHRLQKKHAAENKK